MRRVVLLVLGMVVAVSAVAQEAGWTRIGQEAWPYRPPVGDIVRTAEGALLACPFGDGLHRSTDEGDVWAPVDLGENLPGCGLVAAGDGPLFAGTETGVFRSDDEGLTWTLFGLPERWIYVLERGPDGRLWAIVHEGDFDRALLRSDDGATWTFVADEEMIGADFVGAFRTISFSPEGVVFIGATYGLFRSADDGLTWEEAEIDPSRPGTVPASGVTFAPSGVAYVGAKSIFSDGRGVYRSEDGGATWSVTPSPHVLVEALVVTGDGEVLAGTENGLYRSADGSGWEPAGLNAPRRRVTAVLPGENGTPTFVGTDKGVYRSAESADEWERANEGFQRPLVVDAVVVGDTLFASANGELYRYDPIEDHWTLPANAGLLTSSRAFVLVPYRDVLLMGTTYGLFQTGDAGETWEALWLAEGEEERFRALAITSSGTFVLGSLYSSSVVQIGQLFFSEDEGATWTVSEEWDDNPGGIVGVITETPSGALLVGALAGKFNPGDLYRSPDGGETWEAQLGAQPGAIAITPDEAIVAVSGDAHYRSLDDGVSWEVTAPVGGYDLEVAPNEGLAAIRLDREVYYSVDEGLTWTQASTGLFATTLSTDAESFVYAGTARRGIWRSPMPLFVSDEAEAVSPQPFALAPGFPNPSTAAASIPFSLSEAGSVTLTVHDVLGRRVATLVDSVLPSGEHTARWDTAGAASGVYVVTLRAGAQVATQRITVAR